MAKITKADLITENEELTKKLNEYATKLNKVESKLDDKIRFDLENDNRYINLVKERDMYKTLYTNKQKIIDSIKEDNTKLRDKVQELLSTIEELSANNCVGGRPERFTGVEKQQIIKEYAELKSLRKLSKKYSCSPTTIKNILDSVH